MDHRCDLCGLIHIIYIQNPRTKYTRTKAIQYNSFSKDTIIIYIQNSFGWIHEQKQLSTRFLFSRIPSVILNLKSTLHDASYRLNKNIYSVYG